MADHWKTIANALGAPGVDESEVEAEVIAAEVKPEAAPKLQPEQKPQQSSSRPSEFVFDPNSPIPDEALSFKSTKFARSTPHNPPAAGSFSEPTTPAPEARREAPRMPERTESTNMPAATSPPPKPAKRKSSWESLASMFNIKVDRSKPAEEVPEQPVEPSIAAPSAPSSRASDHSTRSGSARSGSDQQLSIFSGGEPSTEPNAALRSMFGDVPQRTNENWGKQRMVDDLGWDEVEEKSASSTHSTAQPSSQAEQPAGEEEVGDEMVRRGRRRRRGRRGRGDSLDAPAATEGEKTSHWIAAEEEVSGDDDEWPEPDSFEADEAVARTSRSQRAIEPEVDSEIDELSSEGEPLRRSSRRRRRGRGRGRERETADGTEAVSRDRQRPRVAPPASIDDDDEDVVGFVPEVDEEDDFESDVPRGTPRPKAAGDDELAPRGRRRRRGRGGSGRGEEEGNRETAPARSRGPRDSQRPAAGRPIEDDDFEPDLEPVVGFEGEEDELDSGGKHRNIPTWADSIESLVTANLENRKRGDNRGAPRGRPKGRR